MIDKSLAALPRRQTDGAIIVRSKDSDSGEKARVFKLNANPGEPILLERYAPHPTLSIPFRSRTDHLFVS